MSNFAPDQIVLQSLIDSGLCPAWRLDFATSIAGTRNPSVKQLDWVKKIIADISGQANTAAPQITGHTDDFSNIFKLFETAKSHGLKWPKVALVYQKGASPRQHRKVLIKLLGPNSRNPGALGLIVDNVGYCGCIRPDSTIIWTKVATQGFGSEAPVKDALRALMVEFNKDPAAMASEHGKMLSSCCFCRLPLSTAESLAVGYGDTCAKHWHLPWGVKKLTDAEILEVKSGVVSFTAVTA
jgi:hypothetical protein